uniref:UDP-N-acetylglucosamine transferase subunit ALG14 n=1 Tax=Chlamydomonas euryale TaxID=1486919 RepID=A0A7R9VZC0_9CHLO|mmetsp:Transcript_7300/g.22221  ORF Transcript_7300/g.22221 Transcript_7300/m.22221 type:complete len:262 (+) Transcript_7300:159-944(+)
MPLLVPWELDDLSALKARPGTITVGPLRQHAGPLLYVAVVFGVAAMVVAQLLVVLALVRALRASNPPPRARTMVVLGSGGHTAEMLKLMQAMDKARYSPRVYVVAATDKMSGRKAEDFEARLQDAAAATTSDAAGAADCEPAYEVWTIPRSREVGQSYVTSVWTTLVALVYAARAVALAKPDVLLVNGPGTCIPIAFAAYVFRLFWPKPCRIFYVESIARTRKLSLSGLILYHLRMADLLFVQWDELQRKYPRTTYAGRLY